LQRRRVNKKNQKALLKVKRWRKETGMAGLFALSADPTVYRGRFSEDLFWETFYQQHLGEEYAGLSISDGQTIRVQTHRGLFRSTFGTNFETLRSPGTVLTEGIGYCGSSREPFLVDSKMGEWSICFSGNIINRVELINHFKTLGHIFEKRTEEISDIEVIAKLIAQGEGLVDGIKKMTKAIRGTYSLLILTTKGIFAVRSPSGHWPLVIGKKEGAVAVASEPGGFNNFGFKLYRDVKPGEVILLKDGRLETRDKIPAEKIQICSFVWVYTAFANGVFEGVPASLVRKRLGAALARCDIERGFIPDIVAAVPDSGRFHAIGYHQEFCHQINERRINRVPFYDEVLLKYAYAGRSYTPQTKKARDREAHIKIVPAGEDYSGKIVVICDDSIVRGTQTQTNLVPKARALGIKEVHFRISNPELLSHCPWGKTTQRGECLAERMPNIEDRVRFLGVDSLFYNTIDDLVAAIGLPREQLCVDCSLPS
jgi:amidophosphoribosyltransferase